MRGVFCIITVFSAAFLFLGCLDFLKDEKLHSEINIIDDSGNIYPESKATYDFGTLTVGQESAPVNFTIQNLGKSNLVLSGNPVVTIGGFSSYEYKIISQPSSTIAKGSSSTFTIVFAPLGGGIREANISIPNNDTSDSENPKTFNLTGNAAPIISTVLAAPYISGSLSLGGGVVPTKIKIGLFFGSGVVQSGNSKFAFDSLKGRLYYINNNNKGNLYQFTPSVLGNYNSGSGTYFINFPDITKITTTDVYYLVAWYDTDNDGILNLYAEGTQSNLDLPSLTYANQSDYNRAPVVNITDPNNLNVLTTPTNVYVSYFEQEKNTSNYEFKYYSVANPSTVHDILNTTESGSTNFNFTISNTVDTN